MDLKKRLEDLERKVKELEARPITSPPVYVPYPVPQPYPVYHSPYYPYPFYPYYHQLYYIGPTYVGGGMAVGAGNYIAAGGGTYQVGSGYNFIGLG